MTKGFKIGRILGIEIRLDWSWLLIFILVTWNLGITFGDYHADWSLVLQWGLALLAALLFFSSVLAHEMAHSVVAQSRGIPVRSIKLHLFGGVSNIQRDPDSPGSEFWMAIVGPVTSLVLGFLLLGIAGTGSQTLRSVQNPAEVIPNLRPVPMMLMWLGSVNIILGVFNLIPGFPLDGGRVLRSILWSLMGDLQAATRWASRVGQSFAWLMIFGGVSMTFGSRIPFFGTGVMNGLWLIFIGWFLNSASIQSYQKVVVQDILEGVPVQRMMRTDPPTVAPDVSIDGLVHEHVMGSDDHAFPVLDEGRLVGIVTLDDIRGVPKAKWEKTRAREIMTPRDSLTIVTANSDADHAMNELSGLDVRLLPVVQEEELVGVLRRRDIIRWLQLESEAVTDERRS